MGLTLAQFDRLDPDDREYRILQWQRRRSACPDCGHPIAECSDPERAWYSYRRTCYATMAREAAEAMYAALHDAQPFHDGSFMSWTTERSRDHPFSAQAGVTIDVADYDVNPHDEFTTKRDASPFASVAVEGGKPVAGPVGIPGSTVEPIVR